MIEVVTRRADFLETLATTPLEKPAIVDTLEHSRSTVDRAIRTLEDAGLVERATDGYVTTVAGRLAAQRYRAFLDDERDILAAHDAMAPLPASSDVPVAMLSGASATTGEGEFWLFDHVGELLRSAERYRAVVPRLGDSRHLRLCRARAERGALEATLLTGPNALAQCREEFPRLAVAMADADGLAIHSGETPPYGLSLFERADGSVTVGLATYDESGVAGFVRNDSAAAVEWARERFETLLSGAHDATADLRDVEVGDDVPALAAGERRLSPRLRSQGFVRVDADYLDDREPLDTETEWRAGRGSSDVAAGDAVDSECAADDCHASVLEELQERLREGQRLTLLGPPGAGKGTCCKQIAVRWHEAEDGAVFYRESGSGRAFEAIGALESAIESDPGHTLVVVEDAVRAEANTVLEVMRAVSGRSDVSFLLTARDSEWHEPDALPVDARLEAFRQEAIATVTMPTRSDRSGSGSNDDSSP